MPAYISKHFGQVGKLTNSAKFIPHMYIISRPEFLIIPANFQSSRSAVHHAGIRKRADQKPQTPDVCVVFRKCDDPACAIMSKVHNICSYSKNVRIFLKKSNLFCKALWPHNIILINATNIGAPCVSQA